MDSKHLTRTWELRPYVRSNFHNQCFLKFCIHWKLFCQLNDHDPTYRVDFTSTVMFSSHIRSNMMRVNRKLKQIRKVQSINGKGGRPSWMLHFFSSLQSSFHSLKHEQVKSSAINNLTCLNKNQKAKRINRRKKNTTHSKIMLVWG